MAPTHAQRHDPRPLVRATRSQNPGGRPPSSPGPVLTTVFTCLLLLLSTASAVLASTGVNGQMPACASASSTANGQQGVCNCNPTNDGHQVVCAARTPLLTQIPWAIPEDTSVLSLASNNITLILKGQLAKLENMRTLFLQQNSILFIEDGAFDNLYSLRLLVLSSNKLMSIPDSWFQSLPSIQSIDLSNNQIRSIDRRAFLNVPASNFQGSVSIQLGGNRLLCDCDARAIRDWSQSLSAPLARVQLNGFQCTNANGMELNSLADNDFACSGSTPAMFETPQQCATCRNQPTQQTCDSVRVARCGSQQPVCQTQVKMVADQKLEIYKSCGAYTDCLQRARDNYRSCNLSHVGFASATMDCFFCCSGPSCNLQDMGGRTKSFRLYVGIRLKTNFEVYMAYPQDARYVQKANIYTQKLNEIFQGVAGGFDTTFLSFRNVSGRTYVTCLVYATSLNTYTVTSVGAMMTSALQDSMTQGFLKQEEAAEVYVGTELVSTKRCPKEVTQTAVGAITWPEAFMGTTTAVLCPTSRSAKIRYAQRACVADSNGVAKWQDPDVSACWESDVTDDLLELNDTVITPANVDEVLTELQQLTSRGAGLNPTDVTLAMDVVERALRTGAALEDSAAMDSTLQVLSNVLDADDQALVMADRANRSTGRLLAVADRLGAEGKLGSDGQLLMTAPNLAVGALAVDSDTFRGASLTARPATDNAFKPGDVQIQPKSISPGQDINSLVLPESVVTSSRGSRIAMKAWVSDKPFKVIQQSTTGVASDARSDVSRINSHVLDASVVGRDVRDLEDPVSMTYIHLNKNASNPACVFWDVRQLRWSSEGCSLAADLSTDTSSTCRCTHLTNFALLMDVYGEGDSLSDTDKQVLSIISYIGCGVSLLALLLTLITYILFKKLRRDNPSKILVNLCIALALSNLVFVAGMHPYALNHQVGCKIVAVLLHFSLLSALCWMAVEAFYMYLALVLVFKTYFTNFILKCSLIGWGIPLVIVAITLGINKTDNYERLSTGVCWLNGLSFYVAFLGPVCLILLINFLAFGLVLRQILGLAERKLNKSDSFTTAQQLRGAVGVAILLGLTWVFALFAIDRASVVFYYLFAIFNSLQGLWIFVFYCLLKKEARNAWRRALPCCRTLDDKSTISNTRAGYSGAVTKTERSKSSTDNGATTTTAFTSSTVDSDGAYENIDVGGKVDHKEKPGITGAVEAKEVRITLSDEGNHTKNNGDVQPPADQPTRIVHRSEGNVTLPATVSKGAPSPQSTTTVTINGMKVLAQDGSSTKVSSEGSQASPQPLRFKVGYTLSNTSTVSSQQCGESESSGPSYDNQPSVAELIKKMNTRL